MWRASIVLLVVLCTTGCHAELPKTTPQCSKDWGGWWDAFHCGTYPLHWAVASGNMELTKKLLDEGWDINLPDEIGWTPIIEAAFFGKQHISVELVRRGADVYTKGGYFALNVVKVAKLKWCIEHSSVNTCPTTLYDYDRTIEVLFLGCKWTECEDGFMCIGRRCWPSEGYTCVRHDCWPDKCHKVKCSDENAKCVVENRKPICRCKPGFLGTEQNTTNTTCEAISGDSKTGMETGNLVLEPCPEGYYLFGSQCLYIDDRKKATWTDAAKRCKRNNGVLAKIEDPGEFSSYLDEFYPKMTFWLGGNDRKKEGVWRWYSGEVLQEDFPWGVNHRGKQQPNDGANNEDCMSIKYFNADLKFQYVDNKCTLRHYFACTAPRNYVDDVLHLSNNVDRSTDGNSIDEAFQGEPINMESESTANGNGLNINIGQNNISTGGINQTLNRTTINRLQINNVNSNNGSNNGNQDHVIIETSNERLISTDNINSDIVIGNEHNPSITRDTDHKEIITSITRKYIPNISESNGHRLGKLITNVTDTNGHRMG